jgi:hypothetical protein
MGERVFFIGVATVAQAKACPSVFSWLIAAPSPSISSRSPPALGVVRQS